MSDSRAVWDYPLIDTTENKVGERTNVPYGVCAELVGVDGKAEGGLRPFPGFKFEHELTGNLGSGHSDQEVKAFPVTWRVDDVSWARGYVYRVTDGEDCKIFLDYRVGDETAWTTAIDLVGAKTYGLEPWHVVVFGRLVYVFVRGQEPFVFYLEDDGMGGWTLTVDTNTGPGPAPTISGVEASSCCVAYQTSVGSSTTHPDMAEVLTVMQPPAAGDADARVLFFGFSNLEAVSTDPAGLAPAPFTNPFLGVRNPDPTGHDEALVGPSQLRDENNQLLWATPPFPDPVFGLATFYDAAGVLIDPTYPYPDETPPSNAHGEAIGYAYHKEQKVDDTPIGIAADGTMVVAYQLYDSRTGRRSALSNRFSAVVESSYGASSIINTPFYLNGLRQATASSVTFVMFQIIYDAERYDTLLLYRGVASNGLNPEQAVLALEVADTLDQWLIDSQPWDASAGPGDPDWKVAAYFFQLDEDVLSLQPKWLGGDTYQEEMPTAGTAYFYETTLLTGNEGVLDTSIGGLGVVRWSDPLEAAIELFRPSSKYMMQTPDEEVQRFARIGPNVLGVTRFAMYVFRRETDILKGFSGHEGFGTVNPRAMCEVGSQVFVCGEQGLQIIDSDGTMTEVSAVNNIIVSEWAGYMGDVELAYDAVMGVIVIHNPDLKRSVLLWRNTSRVTEIVDADFSCVREGDVLYEPDVAGSPPQKRAVFVQPVKTSGSGADWKWRTHTIDYDRRKDGLRFMDYEGDAVVTVSGPHANTSSVTVSGTLGDRIEGSFLYVLEGDHAGEKVQILRKVGQVLTLVDNLPALAAGTRLAISPVYFRVIGWMLGVQRADGTPGETDFFTQRHFEQLACSFTDVQGDSAGTEDAKWRGSIWKGVADEALETAFPLDAQGEVHESVQDGPSKFNASFGERHGRSGASLFPGVEVFTPDLDFRLLAMRVTGNMRVSDRDLQRG